MIWGRWVEPNFKFTVLDKKGDPQEYLCYAPDADELKKRLDAKGYKGAQVAPYDFAEWKKKARRATDKAIWQRIKDRWSYFQAQARDKWTWLTDTNMEAIKGDKKALIEAIRKHDGCKDDEAVRQIDEWSSTVAEESPAPGQVLPKTAIGFNDAIWKEIKWHLFDLFHGKCAYCESKPLPSAWGDVEHYRPKGKVDEDENHPGYYWLAYNETNLLPSCSLCNGHGAKLTHFPVAAIHARDSRGIDEEQPLLLNPYNRKIDPFLHLEFDATGTPQPLNQSPYGERSREIYNLDRAELFEARFAAIQLVEGEWRARIARGLTIPDAHQELREDILRGERQYSAAQLWELDRLVRKTLEKLVAVPRLGNASAPQGP